MAVASEALRFALKKSGIEYRSAKIAFTVRDQAELKETIQKLKALGCRTSRCSTSQVKNGWVRVAMVLRYKDRVESDGRLLSELASHQDLRMVKND